MEKRCVRAEFKGYDGFCMKRASSSAKQNRVNKQRSCMIRKPIYESCWPQYDTQQQVYEKIVCIVMLSFVFRNIYIKSENFTLFVCNEVFFILYVIYLLFLYSNLIFNSEVYTYNLTSYNMLALSLCICLYTFLFLKYTVIPVVRYACAYAMSFSF